MSAKQTKGKSAPRPVDAAIADAKAVLAEAYRATVAAAVEDFLAKFPRFRGPDLDERAREACTEQLFEYVHQHPIERDPWLSLVAFLATENPDQYFNATESWYRVNSKDYWWRAAGWEALVNDMLARIERLWTPLERRAGAPS